MITANYEMYSEEGNKAVGRALDIVRLAGVQYSAIKSHQHLVSFAGPLIVAVSLIHPEVIDPAPQSRINAELDVISREVGF